MPYVHVVTTCREHEISDLSRRAQFISEKIDDPKLVLHLLLSKGDKWNEESLRIAGEGGFYVNISESDDLGDPRPLINDGLRMSEELNDEDIIVLANGDLKPELEMIKEFLKTVRANSFRVGFWHRLDKQIDKEIGFYTHGIDIAALKASEARGIKIDQNFRFGKVGWDYVLPIVMLGRCRQEFYTDKRLCHQVHATNHKMHEWRDAVANILGLTSEESSWSESIVRALVLRSDLAAKMVFWVRIVPLLRNAGWQIGRRPYSLRLIERKK